MDGDPSVGQEEFETRALVDRVSQGLAQRALRQDSCAHGGGPLYCLPGRRGRARCFERVRAHLASKGEFYFDVWSAEAFEARTVQHPKAFHDDMAPIVTIQHRHQLWDVFERSRRRRARRLLDVTYRYTSRSRAIRIESHVSHAYATRAELDASLTATGLKMAQVWGDFSRGRFTRRSELLIVRAVRG